MQRPPIVSRDEWTAARKRLLVKEKEFNRQRDELSAERRKLSMEEITKEYVFQGPAGRRTLADLFDGKRQLLVYHFMFGPDYEEGCPACSFVADNFAGSLVQLAARDTAFAVISRAPLDKIEPFKKRMGWSFPWLSFDPLLNTYNFLDLTPLGRQEADAIMRWLRYHDKY
jgi:predicted dithiol-disulfide oxidoreductase (DUF899 family)